MNPQSELGPVLTPRGTLFFRAREIEAKARIVADCTRPGPACDTARAERVMQEIAALAGGGELGA